VTILDKAASALDIGSEMDIQRALGRLMRVRTAIAVARRLSTLTFFDRIIVVQCGCFVENETVAGCGDGPGFLTGCGGCRRKAYRLAG